MTPGSREAASVALAVVGILAALAGAAVWWATSATVNECASTLVRTLDASTCANYGDAHTVAAIVALAGVALAVYGIARR